MSKPVRTFTMGDIARDAEDIGIFYNRAIDFLSDDEICVSPEGSSQMMYLSDFQPNAYGNDEETIKIMLHFFNKHKITEFLITK